MDATGLVWLAAGTGLGLTLAMFILGGVLLVDGRKMNKRVRAAKALKAAEPAPRTAARPAPVRPVVTAPPPQRKAPPAKPVEAAPTAKAVAPVVPQEVPVSDADAALVRDLAAAIEQSRTAEAVAAKPAEAIALAPPAPEPVQVAQIAPVETPKPVPAPVPAEPVKAAESEIIAEPAPIRVAKPAPPLPKVTPARKFAPALPPKAGTPPAESS